MPSGRPANLPKLDRHDTTNSFLNMMGLSSDVAGIPVPSLPHSLTCRCRSCPASSTVSCTFLHTHHGSPCTTTSLEKPRPAPHRLTNQGLYVPMPRSTPTTTTKNRPTHIPDDTESDTFGPSASPLLGPAPLPAPPRALPFTHVNNKQTPFIEHLFTHPERTTCTAYPTN